ncbi:MAG: SelB C-terminal domain-containing protein, partial [Dehalococcoidia bacterium]|nr:SelB C-terminal domain-containing protein [Dehalococcoidia bacterium]
KGDLFIVRSANETLGGGEVIEPRAKRRRRHHDATIARLAALERGSPNELALQTLRAHEPMEVATFLRLAPIGEPDAKAALATLIRDGAARVLADREPTATAFVISTPGWEALRAKAIAVLDGHHRQFPLRPGMPKEELKSRLHQSARLFADTVASLVRSGDVVDLGQLIKRADHTPSLNPAQAAEAHAFLAALRATPFAPPSDRPIAPDLLAYLLNDGQVVRVADGVIFDAAAYQTMVDAVVTMIRETGSVTVAAVRDRFQTSRKYALALLEHLDERKITRRQGDDRVLR